MIVTVTVRARYCDGTLALLEPLEVVDLEEGAEVEIAVRGILPPEGEVEPGDGLAEVARAIRERRNNPRVTTATYGGGAFTPCKPLGFDDGEVVRLTVGKVPPGEGEADELIQISYEHRVGSSRSPSAP